MKKKTFQLLFFIVAGLLTAETIQAQGTIFTYQGRLNTAGGAANDSYDLTFTMYATNNGGSAVAGPLTNSAVSVSNGLFTVTVDFGGGVFDGSPRWLEIGVSTNGAGAFTTLSPRQALLPAPYAMAAGNLVGTATNQVNSAVQAATSGLATTNYVNTATNGFVTAAITNGLATTEYALTTATNIASALTNGLASISFVNTAVQNGTNNLLVTVNGNIQSATNNALATATNAFDVTGAALNATNAFASGELKSATNNALATATNSFLSINTAIPATNGFVTATITNGLASADYVLTQGTNIASALTNGLASTSFVNTTVQNGTNNLLVVATNAANLVGVLPQYPTVQIATNAPFTNAVLLSPDGTNRAWGSVSAGGIAGLGSAALQGTNFFDLAGAGTASATAATNNFGNTIPVTMTNMANQISGAFTGNGGGLTNYAQTLFQNSYFVDAGLGNDTNAGDINHPWATGNHYVPAGDSIFIAAGTYAAVFTNQNITYVLDDNAYARFYPFNCTNVYIGGHVTFGSTTDPVLGSTAFSNAVVTCRNCLSWSCNPDDATTNSPYISGATYGNNYITNYSPGGTVVCSLLGQEPSGNHTNYQVVVCNTFNDVTNTNFTANRDHSYGYVNIIANASISGGLGFPDSYAGFVPGSILESPIFYVEPPHMKFLNASGGTIGSPAGAVYWNIGYTVSATNLILATGPIIMMNSPAFDGPPALASNNSSQTYGYAQILPSTNTLAVPSSGVTNKTIIPYTISVTAGTGMAVVDQAGHQFFTPVINSTFPLQSKQRLTGTGITATGVQQ